MIEISKESVSETVSSMQEWPHWGEIARGAQKEYQLSEEAFFQLLPEFQRFMALAKLYPGIGMLSEKVDMLWHSLILNTVRYREFCEAFIGRFIDHLPCSSFDLYGFEPGEILAQCEIPATCTDPFPSPPDPSPTPSERMHNTISQCSERFLEAYTEAFGRTPDSLIWPRVASVDTIAR